MIKTLVFAMGVFALTCFAQPAPSGQMKVDGKVVKFTNAYAYLVEGFFDKKKDDTVVFLSDRPLTDGQLRDEFGIRHLAEDGKLKHALRHEINAPPC